MPKLLLIDDDEAFLNLVRVFMTAQNWSFTGAVNAASGLKELEKEKPDLILLDINLPDKSGFEVCKTLKNDPMTAGIPLILISGYKNQAEDILRGLGYGGDNYLVKPVLLPVLKARLEAALKPSKE
ncbi:MAG: response regulator [Elusimicrobia bacterium]|nr:response regulator [Elusimicrobiota bacterium]